MLIRVGIPRRNQDAPMLIAAAPSCMLRAVIFCSGPCSEGTSARRVGRPRQILFVQTAIRSVHAARPALRLGSQSTRMHYTFTSCHIYAKAVVCCDGFSLFVCMFNNGRALLNIRISGTASPVVLFLLFGQRRLRFYTCRWPAKMRRWTAGRML